MQYRQLGRTGLNVSVLGFGASPLGGVFGPVAQEDGNRSLRLALDGGVNFVDVSPYYGLTRAETALGCALRGIPRERYYLATKAGRYGDQPCDFNFSAGRVIRSVDESLQRLGVEYVDLIQCHDIEFGSLQQIIHETIPALRRVVQQGKARFVGITGLPLKVFTTVLEQVPVDTVLSYCRYSLNDNALGKLIPWLQDKGVGIINASPLSMGLLTPKGPPDWHPAPDELRTACAAAARHCQERGAELPRLALQYAVANRHVHTTLVGSARPDNIARNLKWIEEPLDEELLREVMQILQPVHNLTWPSGRPENN